MTTAYFGFLRGSEYTASHATTFDPHNTLCFNHVTVNSTNITLTISSSKNDPFRQGCQIKLTRTNTDICPTTILMNWLRIHPTKSEPLFTYTDRTYLTKNRLNSLLHQIFLTGKLPISTHSFRIGAATTAAAAGIPRHIIQKIGR